MKLAALLLLIALPAGAAEVNPMWSIDAAKQDRWMAGGVVAFPFGRTELRSGILASETGVLGLADVVHLNPGGQFYAGLGGAVATEPAAERYRVETRTILVDGDPVAVINNFYERPSEARLGAYAVFGMRGTDPDGPNATVEVRLMGFDNGPRVVGSVGVVF